MTKDDILQVIREDSWMMQVLRTARELDLPDWMIGAGFVRNKIWDHLHGFENEQVQTNDIDLIYYDPKDLSKETEKEYDRKLREKLDVEWSVKNQARMHLKHGRPKQYVSCEEGLSEWVEIPTCVAVRLEKDDTLTLIAPHGIDDLVNLHVRPTPARGNTLDVFWNRVTSKGWKKKWPKLTFFEK